MGSTTALGTFVLIFTGSLVGSLGGVSVVGVGKLLLVFDLEFLTEAATVEFEGGLRLELPFTMA